MSEFKPPLNEAEFEENFAQKKPLMNTTEAFYESGRCLFCYDAPCVNACPTHIDIPLFIKQIHTGNTEGAAKTIFDSNWFGHACGKVCPTGVLCEGACVYNHQQVKPIEIGRLQAFATATVIQQEKELYAPGESNGKKVAVIGAGPAGISCACELRLLGYEVDIYEAKSLPSGLTVYGVAPYKITNEEVLDEMAYLQRQLGFKVFYNSPVLAPEQIEQLEKNYDAVFIGVGLGTTASLQLPGEEKQNVTGAVEFIEAVRMKHHEQQVPTNVIVIGGGNTAMDAASASARLGAKNVTLAYRRSKEEMGAYSFEYQLAIAAGTQSIFEVTPVEILGNDAVTGVKFRRTQAVNHQTEEIQASEFVLDCDLLILATGQAKQTKLYQLIPNVKLDASKKILVNSETFQTSDPKYFAGGDAINGGAEVVNAAYDGKMAAQGIDKWLRPVVSAPLNDRF